MLPFRELVVSLLELTEALSIEDYSVDYHSCYDVGIDVRSRPSVLKISLLVMDSLGWNSDALAAMTRSETKFLQTRGLVSPTETLVIVVAVHVNKPLMQRLETLNCVQNDLIAPIFSHRLGREISVTAAAVPVSFHRFRVERGSKSELSCDATEQISGHPEIVSDVDAETRSDLELPLGRHYFSVRAYAE